MSVRGCSLGGSVSLGQMGAMIGAHAPLVGASSFANGPGAFDVVGLGNAVAMSQGRRAFFANGAAPSSQPSDQRLPGNSEKFDGGIAVFPGDFNNIKHSQIFIEDGSGEWRCAKETEVDFLLILARRNRVERLIETLGPIAIRAYEEYTSQLSNLHLTPSIASLF